MEIIHGSLCFITFITFIYAKWWSHLSIDVFCTAYLLAQDCCIWTSRVSHEWWSHLPIDGFWATYLLAQDYWIWTFHITLYFLAQMGFRNAVLFTRLETVMQFMCDVNTLHIIFRGTVMKKWMHLCHMIATIHEVPFHERPPHFPVSA